MGLRLLAAALAASFALAGCETTGGAYGGGGGYGGTQLSQCTRNALIGAGVGAVAGALIGSENNRGENAALGGAAAGLATYGVCRWLDARSQQRVEQAYYRSLNTNSSVNDSWQTDQGQPRSLVVNQPAPAATTSGYSECRRVTATISDPARGSEQLPPETFCRNASGAWVPV
ncbi:MAG: hypothetical protein GC189_11590 [Alphaproteobacteria bacterium]|nr:hypothetical protein [Alphaproteobacteria bacterium]